jgi:phosphoribosylformylglycinamidine synthase
MKSAVIVFPGSNCDRDVAVALEQSAGSAPAMVWHRDSDFEKVDVIVLPGGFSYGDYLRCGAIAARSPVMAEVIRRAEAGVPVLGICNGFQILTESGLLPGALISNSGLKYICRDVHIRVENSDSAFTAKYSKEQVLRIPIAHHDGCYTAGPELLADMTARGQIAFRYCSPSGKITSDANPNGSQDNIAGVFNRRRNVLGLMPHPERLSDPELGGNDGRGFFDSLIEVLS